MSLDVLTTGAGSTSLVFALVLLGLLVAFILWIPPRAARPRADATPASVPPREEPSLELPAAPNPIVALYFSAEGRISRSIYWLAQIPLIALNLVIMTIGDAMADGGLALLCFALSIAVTVASIMIGIKRCHDRDKSGWWVALSFVPLIGWIWTIVELGFLQGTVGPNRFGPDPVPA